MLNEYPDVMNVRQVAEALHIGKNSVYSLLDSKEIGSRQIGRKYIIPKVCVVDYLRRARYIIDYSQQ